MKSIIKLVNVVGVAALMASVLARPQFYPLLRGYPPLGPPPLLRAECAVFGCIDQSLGSIGASIISGVNGTLVGAGTGISGIINGTNSILSGSATGAGAAVGGIASSGGNAIGGDLQTIGETIGGRAVTRRLCPVQAYPGSPLLRILTYC